VSRPTVPATSSGSRSHQDRHGPASLEAGATDVAVYCSASGLATLGAVEFATQFGASTKVAAAVAVACVLAFGSIADEAMTLARTAMRRVRASLTQ
jgi:hypothetical protein